MAGQIRKHGPIFRGPPDPVPNLAVFASEPTDEPEVLDDDLPRKLTQLQPPELVAREVGKSIEVMILKAWQAESALLKR